MPCSPAGAPRDANASPSAPGTGINPDDGGRAPSPPSWRQASQSWPRQGRVLRRSEFRAAYEQGLRRSSPHFTVFGLRRVVPAAGSYAGPCGEGMHYGITVTRKQGGAVMRNRIRRRTRELLRHLPEMGPGRGGAWNVIINPRTSVAHADLRLLAVELEAQLQRLATALQGTLQQNS
ncbi:MAG TPA: ribonuclease P protein component [Terriglobales bacterium]